MCSICGGTNQTPTSELIWSNSIDRGRDGQGRGFIPSLFASKINWIGNRRATPTTEVEYPLEIQPVGNNPKIVFNGIISNADDLGVLNEGEADTSVLPRVLNFNSLENFRDSLNEKIIGSFAIACLFDDGRIWLAANYKPIWIGQEGEDIYFSSLKGHFPKTINSFRFPPYSVADLHSYVKSGEYLKLRRVQSPKALVICSSGLDSTAVAAYVVHKHGAENVTLIHYNYGCIATSREINCVTKIAEYLKCDMKVIPMSNFGGSSLLESEDSITEGIKGAEYAHEWVPARNLLMLSTTVAYAEAKKFGHIYLGTNLEEAGAYPDNEEQFILDFNDLLYGAIQNGTKIEIHTPLGGLMKHEIIPFGIKYDTPFHLTWSCYHGKEKSCGKCAPCFMRQTAFKRNNLIDPLEYE